MVRRVATGPDVNPSARRSGVRSRTLPSGLRLALLIRMSTPPNSSTVRATAPVMESASAISISTGSARPPRSAISLHVTTSFDSVRPRDRDGSALLGERKRNSLADALPCASDQGHFSIQLAHCCSPARHSTVPEALSRIAHCYSWVPAG